MKNRKRLAMAVLAVLIALAASACGSPETPAPTAGQSASEDQVFDWKASFGGAPGSFQSDGYVKLCELIGEYTDGTVNIEYYPGGTLFTDPEAVAALQENTVQLAHSAVTMMEPTIHSLGVLAVPGMIRPERYFEFAYGLKDALNAETEPYGIKVLLPTPTGYVCFPSSKQHYKSPGDFKAVNVRVANKTVGDIIQAWGGNPVTIPSNELVTALERGTVETGYVGDITLSDSWKLYEVVPYMTETRIGEVISYACMSMEAWDQLSDNQKAGVEKAVDEYAKWIEAAANGFRAEYQQKLVDNGNDVYVLSEAENAAFANIALETGVPAAIKSGGGGSQGLADICAKLREYADNNPYVPGTIPKFDWIG